ncbi:MAG: hypothetical protein LBP62_01695 [Clostridiales bacterium]|jgi:hypothetical protein|nr:hypothetical protein [Clostridiales bacterium]
MYKKTTIAGIWFALFYAAAFVGAVGYLILFDGETVDILRRAFTYVAERVRSGEFLSVEFVPEIAAAVYLTAMVLFGLFAFAFSLKIAFMKKETTDDYKRRRAAVILFLLFQIAVLGFFVYVWAADGFVAASFRIELGHGNYRITEYGMDLDLLSWLIIAPAYAVGLTLVVSDMFKKKRNKLKGKYSG